MLTYFSAGTLSTVFLAAALSKIRSRAEFREFTTSLARYRLPRVFLPPVVAGLVVAAELAVAAVLLLPILDLRARLVPAVVLMAVFAVLAVTQSSDGASCNCFGSASRDTPRWLHIAINAAILVVGCAGLALEPRSSEPAGSILFATGSGFIVGIAAVTAGYLHSSLMLAAGATSASVKGSRA